MLKSTCLALLMFAGIAAADVQTGVVRSGGQAIPGASVTAECGTDKITTVTDDAGRFEMGGLPSTACKYTVLIFGFEPLQKEAAASSTPLALDITMQGRASIPVAPGAAPPVISAAPAATPAAAPTTTAAATPAAGCTGSGPRADANSDGTRWTRWSGWTRSRRTKRTGRRTWWTGRAGRQRRRFPESEPHPKRGSGRFRCTSLHVGWSRFRRWIRRERRFYGKWNIEPGCSGTGWRRLRHGWSRWIWFWTRWPWRYWRARW